MCGGVLAVFLSFFFLHGRLLELAAGVGLGASSALAVGSCGSLAVFLFFLCGVEDDEEEDALGLDLDFFGALVLDLDLFGACCLPEGGIDLPLVGEWGLGGAGMLLRVGAGASGGGGSWLGCVGCVVA